MREAQVAGGAAGHLLLGRIARLTNRRNDAAAHFNAALERDPLMWQAFEELCHLGAPACPTSCVQRHLALASPRFPA